MRKSNQKIERCSRENLKIKTPTHDSLTKKEKNKMKRDRKTRTEQTSMMKIKMKKRRQSKSTKTMKNNPRMRKETRSLKVPWQRSIDIVRYWRRIRNLRKQWCFSEQGSPRLSLSWIAPCKRWGRKKQRCLIRSLTRRQSRPRTKRLPSKWPNSQMQRRNWSRRSRKETRKQSSSKKRSETSRRNSMSSRRIIERRHRTHQPRTQGSIEWLRSLKDSKPELESKRNKTEPRQKSSGPRSITSSRRIRSFSGRETNLCRLSKSRWNSLTYSRDKRCILKVQSC